MNEASSKFVDRIAVEKLLHEKLLKVHHFPEKKIEAEQCSLFDDFTQLRNRNLPETQKTPNGFRFKTLTDCQYPENCVCQVLSFECPAAKGSLVLQHGLFEDNRAIFNFLIRNLNANSLNVYLTTLPFHYDRTPQDALFSGEYFWSANFQRTRRAFKQGIYELYTLYRLIREKKDHKVLLCGFSMGACLVLLLSAVYEKLHGVFVINPVATLSGIVWDSPLCATIKADFMKNGYSIRQLEAAFALFEPASVPSVAIDPKRIMVSYGAYDQITSQKQYHTLIHKWRIPNSVAYKSGHMNILRVPRLAEDINTFYESLCNRLKDNVFGKYRGRKLYDNTATTDNAV